MGILKKKLLKIVSIFIASRFPLICPNYVMENYSNILEAIHSGGILYKYLFILGAMFIIEKFINEIYFGLYID